MYKIHIGLTMLCLLAGICLRAEDSEAVKAALDSGLQLVEIETVDGEEPTSEGVHAPAGCIGASNINANKVKARAVIRSAEGVLWDSGAYKKNKSGLTVKVRGNTSANIAKKGFKFKLQQPTDLLFRGDEEKYADSEWALLNINNAQQTGFVLETALGFEVNRLLGFNWTPGFRYVNVVMNGDYRGMYILVETVKRAPSSRIDVSENGALFEFDAYWWNEDVAFLTQNVSTNAYKVGYTFKYPDSDDITPEQVANVSNIVEMAMGSIKQGHYDQYIDVDSWARWLMGHDLMGVRDDAGSNFYFTYNDLSNETEKVKMTTMWDFDTSFGMTNRWGGIHLTDHFYFKQLIHNDNTRFGQTYQYIWNTLRPVLEEGLERYLDGLYETGLAASIDKARKLDAARWKYETLETSQEITAIRRWFYDRIAWIDAHLDELTPVADVVVVDPAEPGPVEESEPSGLDTTTTLVVGVADLYLLDRHFIPYGADVSIKGLPSGVKRDKVNGGFTGVPKRAGEYTPVCKGLDESRLPVTVAPFPAYAVGKFNGTFDSGSFRAVVSRGGKVSLSVKRDDDVSLTVRVPYFTRCTGGVLQAEFDKMKISGRYYKVKLSIAPGSDGDKASMALGIYPLEQAVEGFGLHQ